jgi:hypothetical protein
MFRAGPGGEYHFERISEVTVRDGRFNVFEYHAQLLCISSLDAIRNVTMSGLSIRG